MQYLSFYQRYFPDISTNIRKENVVCPFHDDKEPSCSLDKESGLWYCHSCKDGGDIFSFYMRYHNCSFSKAKNDIVGNTQYHILTDTEVREAHERLLNSEPLQKMLYLKRGWNLATIKKYQLGWSDERVFIPIRANDGTLYNIRKYDVLHKSKQKFIGIEGYNQIRLFPQEALSEETIFICAGEPDTLLARQFGFNAITFTGAEGVFRYELLPFFKDKIVYILYDVDTAGQNGAKILANKLTEYAKETYIIHLPEKLLPSNGDFTDLVFYCATNEKELNKVWNPCVELAEKIEKPLTDIDLIHQEVIFYDAVKDEFFNKAITFKATAIGKNMSPYFTPKFVSLKCGYSKGDSCKSCLMFITGGQHDVKIPDAESLNLIKCTSVEQKNRIKDIAGIQHCNRFDMEVQTQTIEEVFIVPVINSDRIDQQFTPRKVYTTGHNLLLNKIYKFSGKTISDPKTQEATHLFTQQEPELSALDTFQLSKIDIENLQLFKPEEDTVEGIQTKIKSICKDITYNIPEVIIGREALIFAYDLVFHSVLSFKFLGSKVNKGLVELLALGDTRTGKTQTALKMCKHYKVGEYITLETATVPGLIGGMATSGRDSIFSWGVLPINDGRLVILDEVNGLDTRDISNLSAIRDTGIAERTIVGSPRKTSARVRLIWISNPRATGRRIENYTSGVEAIRELIGRAEDIARFDFAIIIAKQDVATERINARNYTRVDHIYTSELCNRLMLWAWSRRENQIKFLPETEQLILDYAIEMSKHFTDVIPLVQGTVQRIKLAKLSVALACRLFSTEDGNTVIVKPEHIKFIYLYLNQIYESPYFGYGDYSVLKKEESEVSHLDEVKKFILSFVNPDQFLSRMLNANTLLFDDLMDFADISRDQAKMFKQLLVANNCIKRQKSYFIKTPSFVSFLKKTSEGRREVVND